MPKSPGSGSSTRQSALDFLRLCAEARLGRIAAHQLNNAFTVLVGEVGFLADERKHDLELQQACTVLQTELHRCIRLTRVLQEPGPPRPSKHGESEVDLTRSLRDLESLLTIVLPTHVSAVIEAPDDTALVQMDVSGMRSILLAMMLFLADAARGVATLRVRVLPGEDDRVVHFELIGERIDAEHVAAWIDRRESLTSDPPLETLFRSVREVGARLEVLEAPGGGISATLVFPTV